MKEYVIVAPHADDEIIGCHSLLSERIVKTVFFCSEEAVKEAKHSGEMFGFTPKHINHLSVDTRYIYLFPDPTYEIHPLHRHFGTMGERMLRDGYDVIFYSTQMTAPYIHEVKDSGFKRAALELCYFQKKSLWKYDHKYFLFEGYTKWIMEEHEWQG